MWRKILWADEFKLVIGIAAENPALMSGTEYWTSQIPTGLFRHTEGKSSEKNGSCRKGNGWTY